MLSQMKQHKVPYPMNEKIYNVDEHVPLVQKLLDILYPGQYRIAIFGDRGNAKPIWKGKKRAHNELCLFLKDEHFSGIRKLNTLFGTDYYCLDCETTYDKKKNHRATCLAKCPRCCGMGIDYPCEEIEGYMKQCQKCSNIFRNPKCFHEHIMKNICRLYKRCLDCGQIYRSNKKQESDDESDGNEHVCYSRFCSHCHSIHRTEEPCYVQPIVPKRHRDYILVIFDFECSLISPTRNEDEWQRLGVIAKGGIPSNDENYQLHHVNCVSAMLLCSRCISEEKKWKDEYSMDCSICGIKRKRIITWTSANYVNPLEEFIEWLIDGLGKERRIATYAISHYGGRYDMHLLLGELMKITGIEPNITRSGDYKFYKNLIDFLGNKLYEVLLKRTRAVCPRISFRDSFNWMALKLEQLPKALGLEIDEGGKAFFPHGWNFNKNMNIKLPGLPEKEYYYPESMMKDRRKKFEVWYQENSHFPFCLAEQIGLYCEQDVRVLAHAVIKFQRLFFDIAPEPSKRDDVLSSSLTLASACLRHFCYHRDSNQSAIALKYMQWLEHETGSQVQHQNSAMGEFRLRLSNGELLRLDGYVRRSPDDEDIAIEFLGCAWHGHKCLYKPNDICLNGKTALYNRDKMKERRRLIQEAGMRPLMVWECTIRKQLEEKEDMAFFFNELPDIGPLFPRDAFHVNINLRLLIQLYRAEERVPRV
uniref:DNA-directed DNA polymerase n=2 Tax=Meloidogyne enterolobii TaxID=390850 RepID=A0A6V7Y285_MELEN|nr:unnamed protein product [Meloidogyne enterolobii]